MAVSVATTESKPLAGAPAVPRKEPAVSECSVYDENQPSAILHRNLLVRPLQVASARGKHVTFSNGKTILDTTCGAAVACIGYNNARVKQAMVEQIDKFAYCNSMFYGSPIAEQLAAELIRGTGGAMSKAYIMSSGGSLHRNCPSPLEDTA